MNDAHVSRAQIAATEPTIRPYIRRTPVIEVNGRDFGLGDVTLLVKLELCQQGGSFKARGVVHGVGATGGANRRAPIGAAAYGMPRKIARSPATTPCTGPERVIASPLGRPAADSAVSAIAALGSA